MYTTIIGIDSAVDPKNIGMAKAVFDGNQLELKEIWRKDGLEESPGKNANTNSKHDYQPLVKKVVDWIKERPTQRVLLAIDSPLGWPTGLSTALVGHQAGKSMNISEFPRRVTDQKIRSWFPKMSPLDVGAGLIARTAFSSLRIIEQITNAIDEKEIGLVWNPDFKNIGIVEVYPAATLSSYSKIDPSHPRVSYKSKKKWDAFVLKTPQENKSMLNKFFDYHIAKGLHQQSFESVERIEKEHDFDAFICCLAGRDFLIGQCYSPKENEQPSAIQEGWIWVRDPHRTIPSQVNR